MWQFMKLLIMPIMPWVIHSRAFSLGVEPVCDGICLSYGDFSFHFGAHPWQVYVTIGLGSLHIPGVHHIVTPHPLQVV